MSSFNKKTLILIFILFLQIIFLPACKENRSEANTKIKDKKNNEYRLTNVECRSIDIVYGIAAHENDHHWWEV